MSRTSIAEVLRFLGVDDPELLRLLRSEGLFEEEELEPGRGRGAARGGALDARPRREPGRRGRRAPAPPPPARARGAACTRRSSSSAGSKRGRSFRSLAGYAMRPRCSSPPSSHARPAKRPDDGRLVRGRRSRSKIHEAARALFREQGFDKTTLREIAARAGMGASSIYRHIRSKEELLVEELGRAPAARLDAPPHGRGARAARARAAAPLPRRRARAAACARPTSRRSRCAPPRIPRRASRAACSRSRTRRSASSPRSSSPARSRGELRRDADVLVAARTLTHAVHGARLAWANGLLDAEGCRAAVDAAVALLFDGIGARARRARDGGDGARDARLTC